MQKSSPSSRVASFREIAAVKPTSARRRFKLSHPNLPKPPKITTADRQTQHVLSAISNTLHGCRCVLATHWDRLTESNRAVLQECIDDLLDIREDLKEVRTDLLLDEEIEEIDEKRS